MFMDCYAVYCFSSKSSKGTMVQSSWWIIITSLLGFIFYGLISLNELCKKIQGLFFASGHSHNMHFHTMSAFECYDLRVFKAQSRMDKIALLTLAELYSNIMRIRNLNIFIFVHEVPEGINLVHMKPGDICGSNKESLSAIFMTRLSLGSSLNKLLTEAGAE